MRPGVLPRLGQCRAFALCLWSELRSASGRRVGNQRGPLRRDHRGATIEPETVVRAGCAIDSPVDIAARINLSAPRGSVGQIDFPGDGFLVEIRCFFRSQELLVSPFLRPLHRRDRPKVPHTLQIWLPRRDARNVLRRNRTRRECHKHQNRQRTDEPPTCHEPSREQARVARRQL